MWSRNNPPILSDMSFELGVGKKQNRQGRVELSVRFRLGKIDYQAKTNLWISPAFVKTEKYVSSKGKQSTRLVLTSSRTKTEEAVNADEVKELWSRLLTYIESEYIRMNGADIDKTWLPETIKAFHKTLAPEVPQSTFIILIDDFLKETSTPFHSHTRKQGYLTIRRSLLRYEIYRQITNPRFLLTIEAVDENLLKDFENFQINEHKLVEEFPQLSATEDTNARVGEKSLNTIIGNFRLIKTIFNWAFNNRRVAYNPFVKFKMGQRTYGTPYYLTIDERKRLEEFDFSDTPRDEIFRDIFVFHCCVGCRQSDLFTFTKSHIINGELHYVARKTKEGRPKTIKVPLNSTASKIVEKYSNYEGDALFPYMDSKYIYNRAIKRILKRAGIDRIVVVLNPKTRLPENRPLYEVASTHIARRTFIGNLYKKFKDQGMVSALSGHAPGSQAFARYREIDEEMRKEMVDAID